PFDAVTDQEVDFGLVGLQIRDVLLERALFARRRGEPRERQKFLAPLEIFVDAFLYDRAESIPDLGEALRLLFGERLELSAHAASHRFTYLRELRIVLQHLPRDIERQVFT